MIRFVLWHVVLLTLSLTVHAEDSLSGHFETDPIGSVPEGWFIPPSLVQQGAAAEVTDQQAANGERSVHLSKATQQAFANLMRTFEADPYQGKRVRFSASVRVEPAAPTSRVQMWVRVDRPTGMGFFQNMSDRPIRDRDWSTHEITGDIDSDGKLINIGFMLFGPGEAWIDDVSFQIVGEAGAGAQPAAPISDRELTNLIVFTRILGYVRHFHASDAAAETDWDMFAVRGVHVVQEANSSEELAERLNDLFANIAPTLEITTTKPTNAELPEKPAQAQGFLTWDHRGFGQNRGKHMPRHIYNSERSKTIDPQPPIIKSLGDGLWCRLPLSVPYDDQGTLPRPAIQEPVFDWQPPKFWFATGDDRATRLAAIVLGWNVFQHFYPYFDVIDTDWERLLPTLLRRAANDNDAHAFAKTIQLMVAALQDGHGFASPVSNMGHYQLPFLVDLVEDRVVVTESRQDGVQRGDVITALADQDAMERWMAIEATISAPARQWKTAQARNRFGRWIDTEPFPVTFQRPQGEAFSLMVAAGPMEMSWTETRPEPIAELEKGIWYVDLDRIDDTQFNQTLPQLAEADGVIFDLRGYPRKMSVVVLSHLTDEQITCAQWHIPRVRRPDRENLAFDFSNWPVMPQEPRITAPAAFITDGRAISYAETYLGIVEHYQLADIIGGPTAATNGNVNSIRLPGDYSISFTGMKVLKHDGSQHHGVGIQPTVPVARTIAGVAAGRDELLEEAVATVKGHSSR